MIKRNRVVALILSVLIVSTNFTLSSLFAANEQSDVLISKFLDNSGSTTKLVFDKTKQELLFEDNFSKYTNDASGFTDFSINWDIDSNQAEYFGNKDGEGLYKNVDNRMVLQWGRGMAMRRTEMFSNTLTTFQVSVNEGRPGWGYGTDNANNRAGYAIRQSEAVEARSLYESDFAANPQADSKHLAFEGIIFEFDIADLKDVAQGSALVIVVKSLKDDGNGDSISYRAKLPEGTSFMALQNVSVIDNGSTLLVFVNDILMGKITLENNVDGTYKTATIFDATSVEKAKTTNAIVPESGLAGFGQRCTLVEVGNYKVYNLIDKTAATAEPTIAKTNSGINASPSGISGSSSKSPSPSSTKGSNNAATNKDGTKKDSKGSIIAGIVIAAVVLAGVAITVIMIRKKK